MSTHKFIIRRPDVKTNEDKVLVNLHILVGYTQNTLKSFKGMIEQLKTDFPFINEDDVYLGQVTKSRFYDNFTIIAWNGVIDKDMPLPNGWCERQIERSDEYWTSY